MLSTTAVTTGLLTALLTSMATDPAAGDACASTPAAAPLLTTAWPTSPLPTASPVAMNRSTSTIVPPALLAAPPPTTAAQVGDLLARPPSPRAVYLPELCPLLLLIGGAALIRPGRGKLL